MATRTSSFLSGLLDANFAVADKRGEQKMLRLFTAELTFFLLDPVAHIYHCFSISIEKSAAGAE